MSILGDLWNLWILAIFLFLTIITKSIKLLWSFAKMRLIFTISYLAIGSRFIIDLQIVWVIAVWDGISTVILLGSILIRPLSRMRYSIFRANIISSIFVRLLLLDCLGIANWTRTGYPVIVTHAVFHSIANRVGIFRWNLVNRSNGLTLLFWIYLLRTRWVFTGAQGRHQPFDIATNWCYRLSIALNHFAYKSRWQF